MHAHDIEKTLGAPGNSIMARVWSDGCGRGLPLPAGLLQTLPPMINETFKLLQF